MIGKCLFMYDINKAIENGKMIKAIDFVVAFFAAVAFSVMIGLHAYVPFFPVLFVFDICFWVGHPLFLYYVLQKKWSVCIHDDKLRLQYITIPWLIMELLVMFCYPSETIIVIKSF